MSEAMPRPSYDATKGFLALLPEKGKPRNFEILQINISAKKKCSHLSIINRTKNM